MKNVLSLVLALALSSIFFSSCRQMVGLDCGKDIEIGRIELTDDTKSFFPYTDAQSIVIKNAQGEELILKQNPLEPTKLQHDQLSSAARLCDDGLLDRQEVLYRTTYFRGSFSVEGSRSMNFTYYAYVSANGKSRSEVGISDAVALSSSADKSTKGSNASAYVHFRGDTTKIPALHRSKSLNSIRFVADTTIGGKNFKNVMTSNNGRHSVSVAKGKGLVAIKFDEELWVMERVE